MKISIAIGIDKYLDCSLFVHFICHKSLAINDSVENVMSLKTLLDVIDSVESARFLKPSLTRIENIKPYGNQHKKLVY